MKKRYSMQTSRFYSFALRGKMGMCVISVESDNKVGAEKKMWNMVLDSKNEYESYAGVYTKNELSLVVGSLKKAVKRFSKDSAFAHNTICNPKKYDNIWSEIKKSTTDNGYLVDGSKMWDYYSWGEVNMILDSASDHLQNHSDGEGQNSSFLSRLILPFLPLKTQAYGV